MKKLVVSLAILACFVYPKAQESWQSEIVHFGTDGKLEYIRDSEGNWIPDFSHAGYKGGGVAIPTIPVVKTVSPIPGDNTAYVQAAIDSVSGTTPDADGFRGAILLRPGIYEIAGTLKLKDDGVILRGSGDGADPANNTILYATGDTPPQRTVLVAGGGVMNDRWKEQVSGTKTDIVTDSVLVGDREFEVASAASFSVGDNIIIYHPCTAEWLTAIDSGGTHWNESGAEPGVDLPWAVGSTPIVYNRRIMKIDGNRITIDAPVFNTLVRSLSQSYIYKYARTGLKMQIGVENLRIDIQTADETDENHAWQAVDLFQIEDAWVTNCTFLHFGQSGVRANTATRITVENCNALDPVSTIEGERRYNFNIYTASQLILFKDCHATNGRHHYVSNGTSWTSGCVFLNCTGSGAYTSSEGHRQWSNGLLYDNYVELDGPRPGLNPRLLGLYNRGNYGTSHGWAIAHSVAWNCNLANGDLIVQKPPTAQNYAIGCFAKNVVGVKPPAPFDEPEGYIEGTNRAGLQPPSLYLAQLSERLNGQSEMIPENPKNLPDNFALEQNYPNPFNGPTVIRYRIPSEAHVNLTILDLRGNEIAVVFNEMQSGGNHSFCLSVLPVQMSSGVYFYRLKANDRMAIRKLLLVK